MPDAHGEASAPARHVRCLDGAPVHLDDAVADGEPEAGALAYFLRCEKGREHLRQVFFGYAGARVGNRHGELSLSLFRGHPDGPPVRHRFPRVLQKIVEDLSKLTPVHLLGSKGRIPPELYTEFPLW